MASSNTPINILEDSSLESISKIFLDKKNIIVMSGAGISTTAMPKVEESEIPGSKSTRKIRGIPDFRTPGTGLYDNLEKFGLPFPEAIFDLDYFRLRPEPFFALAKELYPGTFSATLSHFFIRLLDDNGVLLRNYTQNIDTLELQAGIDPDKIVFAHGSFQQASCVGSLHAKGCGSGYSQEWMRDVIFRDEVPTCETCSGIVKPDITFFGEGLPGRFFECLSSDFGLCDLLIVLGTSLTVTPFCELINRVSPSTPRLLINMKRVGDCRGSTTRGFDFSGSVQPFRRDALWLGSCDLGIWKLARLAGWDNELRELFESQTGHGVEAALEGQVHVEINAADTISSSSGDSSSDSDSDEAKIEAVPPSDALKIPSLDSLDSDDSSSDNDVPPAANQEDTQQPFPLPSSSSKSVHLKSSSPSKSKAAAVAAVVAAAVAASSTRKRTLTTSSLDLDVDILADLVRNVNI